MTDEELKHLQTQAIEASRLAQGKLAFLAQHGVVNPLAIMQDRVEWLVDWLIPNHVDEEGNKIDGPPMPTNPERLRFDLWCNQESIKRCDEAMGMQGGLHVVKGVDDNGK